MKKILIGLLTFISLSGFAQERYIKDFAEKDRSARLFYPICLYPSTLRMINLTQNEDYNSFVKGVEKLLIYKLDSSQLADDHTSWMDKYISRGYEEYVTVYGAQTLKIIGSKDEYVGLVGNKEQMIAFYLRGRIAAEKIPSLINNFQSNELLGILSNQF